MSAHDVMSPDQFHTLKFGGAMEGENIASMSEHMYKYDAQRTNMLEEDVVAAGGVTEPVTISPADNEVRHGHHRLAVAYKLGIPVPFKHGLDTGAE
jgi:hypothetical protein